MSKLGCSLPIFMVVLGSVASSREQLVIFFSSDAESSPNLKKTTPESTTKATPESTTVVSRIIYLVGLITILLGVVNNIVRPPESYDTSANYSNKFSRFEQNLDLEFMKKLGLNGKLVDNNNSFEDIMNFLIEKSDELYQLIQEYNDARSLSPRQTHLQALNKDKNKDDLQQTTFVICLNNQGCEDSLKVGKLYRRIDDEQGQTNGSIRVIDEGGKNSAFSVQHFYAVELPQNVEEALSVKS